MFGGTFDPPHNGHVAVARAVHERLGLDCVMLVVANDPWQKSAQREVTPAVDRLAMVQSMVQEMVQAMPAAVDGVRDGGTAAWCEASDMEIRRGGPSYTADTLRELARREPDAVLFLIVGRDLVDELPSWHEPDVIERLATIVVVDRPGNNGALRSDWLAVHVEPVDVSGSQLRQLLRDGHDVANLVPPAVLDTIRARGLYTVKAGA